MSLAARRALSTTACLGVLAMLLTGCRISFDTAGAPGTESSAASAPSVSAASPVADGATPSASSRPTTSPSTAGRGSAADGDWSTVLERVRGGVVRLQVAGCQQDQAWMGSGFVVGPHLVMTAAHVARGARTVSVKSDTGITSARVIGYDLTADVALLRTRGGMGGHDFAFATGEPKLGSDLAVLGYPLAVNQLRISTGIVSGPADPVTYPDTGGEEGFTVEHAFVTDAATNGGNSGGPVVDDQGAVIGLVSGGQNWDSTGRPVQGTNFVVPATDLTSRFDRWRDDATRADDQCDDDAEAPADDAVLSVTVDSRHADAGDLAQALFLHGESINRGNYEGAWSVFTPAQQGRMGSVEKWQQRLSSSYWLALDVVSVTREGSTARARTAFRTAQDASDGFRGQTCTDYDMTFVMRLVDGAWLIDREVVNGSPAAC